MDFRATITPAGELRFQRSREWTAALERWAGRRVVVRLLGEKQQRSLAQNSYIWSVIVPAYVGGLNFDRAAQGEAPLTKEQVYQRLGLAFVPTVQTDVGPVLVKRLSQLDTAEFSKVIDEAREYARERWRMNIPAPNEPWEPVEG